MNCHGIAVVIEDDRLGYLGASVDDDDVSDGAISAGNDDVSGRW